MQRRAPARRLLLLVLALSLAAGLLGCGEAAGPLDAGALRRQFPAQADEVLRGSAAFAPSDGGFATAARLAALDLPPLGRAWAPERIPDRVASSGPRGGLRAWLPRRGDDPVALELPGGFRALVRELGARGEGALVEDAVAYTREGGTSFWVATEAGYEEWLLLSAGAVRRDAPVAAWEVEGAALRQRGEAVEVVDARGASRIRVTAPVAYTSDGRQVAARLAARGATVELWVEAEGEVVLVDPGWLALRHTLAEARQAHTMTELQDGRLLVVGGQDDGIALATAELFDPADGSFTTVPRPMRAARRFHTATLLADGRVLVAGGYSDTHILATAELFDPVEGSWTPVARPMSAARYAHTATLLLDGRVLVAGGEGGDNVLLAAAELFDPADGSWTPVARPMSAARYAHTATRFEEEPLKGRVLVAGGRSDQRIRVASAELFDPVEGSWTTVAPMNDDRHAHTATLLPDGRVLVAGGDSFVEGTADENTSLATAELFDPVAERWTMTTSSMSVSRSEHTATPLPDGRVLVAGGVSRGLPSAGVEIYDPAAGGWSTLPPMGTPRDEHTAALLPDGRVLVAGGSFYDSLDSVERYDPTSIAWTAQPPMGAARDALGAALLPDGRVFVAGGASGDGRILAEAELFDPAGARWTPLPSMDTARAGHAVTRLLDGRVLVTGGVAGWEEPALASAELFDPYAGGWTALPPMSAGRTEHTATLLPDGRVFVAGGSPDMQHPSTSVDLFDPAAGGWTALPPMKLARTAHTATLVPDGRVLVAGGWATDGIELTPVAQVELFDLHAGSWAVLPPMNISRYGHAATLLPDGRVLVVGGQSSDYQASASAEIFDPGSATWKLLPRMIAPRFSHTVTLLDHGRVLVVGGNHPGYSAELLDLLAETWAEAPPMIVPRHGHAAAALPDGRVLVAGGAFDVDGGPLRSVEIFSLQPTGSACSSARDCKSGFCVDGVCCDRACDVHLCEACSEVRGAAEDGACTPLRPACAPFACSPVTGECVERCASVHDCAPGHACHPSGDCVPPPPAAGFRDASTCSALPSPPAPGAARAWPPELPLTLLAAAAALRRRRRRGESALFRAG